MCIYTCVCVNSLLLLWQRKLHKVLHETQINFYRTLSNLEKFRFSRKIRIWKLHSPRSWMKWKLWWANYSFRLPKGLFCRVRFSPAMTKAAWSVPKDPSAPTALRWLPVLTAIHTMPGNSLGSTVGLDLTSDNLSHSRGQPELFQGVGEATPGERLTLLPVEPPQSLCQFQPIF